MATILNLQTAGAMVVIASLIAAELAAWLLASHPGSAFAWYLNLEVFGVFERARAEPSALRFLFGPATLALALAAAATVLAARLARLRLAVSVAANLAFVFAVAVAFCARDGLPPQEASLFASLAARAESHSVVGAILLASFTAAAVSHASYLKAIMIPSRIVRDR